MIKARRILTHAMMLLVSGPLILVAAPQSAVGDETWQISRHQLVDRGFVPLFDGDSLERWNVQEGHRSHWVLRDGVIDYDGRAEQKRNLDKSLWTNDSFGEVQLYVEWRLPAEPTMKPHPIVLYNGDFLLDDNNKRITRLRPDAGDSGILFRGILECQANIWCQELGSGEINGYRVNRKLPQAVRRSCIPLVNADRPMGEWNSFLITLADDRMTVVLNAQQVLESEQLPELPARGPIGLQHHGDPVQFRSIWVKELNATE